MFRRGQWLLEPIRTQADAIRTLSNVRKGWYSIAAIPFVVFVIAGWKAAQLISLGDVGIYLLAGYFLPRQKSRTFAWAMLFCSLYVLVLTLAARFGHYQQAEKNFVLALIAVAIAYRGMKACSVFHRRSHTIWKNVTIVWGATVFATFVIFLASLVVMYALYPDWESQEHSEFLLLIPLTLVWLSAFLVLPRRFPLTKQFSTASEVGA